jgi:hypothetical protein
LHPNTQVANIENLKNTDGNFRMVAIGGGLTAGARDGGLYRNGQLTSFPNLIARQMGVELKQPLFAPSEANGFGYKVLSSMSNGVPKYKAVSNNLAISKTSPIIELNPYNGEIDNWGVPFAGTNDLRFAKNTTPVSYLDLANPYKTRILFDITDNIEKKILNQKFDFFVIETGFDNYINAVFSMKASPCGILLREPADVVIMNYAKTMGVKGVTATIPNILNTPFVRYILPSQIRKANNSELFVKDPDPFKKDNVITVQEDCLLLPNDLADSLLNAKIPIEKKRGLIYSKPLSLNEVYTINEIKNLEACLQDDNKSINWYAKYYNFPVVDLYTVYDEISKGIYTTNDGIKVTQKNFFSSDGIFPSAFGQAIIANEYIKTINNFYKTNIPLIQTAYYLNKNLEI